MACSYEIIVKSETKAGESSQSSLDPCNKLNTAQPIRLCQTSKREHKDCEYEGYRSPSKAISLQ